MGTSDGFFSIVRMAYTAEEKNGRRQVSLAPTARPFTAIGTPGVPIQSIGYGDSGDRKLIAAVQEVDGQKPLHVLSLSRKRSLMARARWGGSDLRA